MKKPNILIVVAALALMVAPLYGQVAISGLPSLSATPDAADVIPLVDTSAGTTKKVTYANFMAGNAGTATALAVNPSPCGSNQFVTDIAAAGTLTCGAISDADVPNTITIDLATVATTANAGDSATSFFSSGEIEDARLPSGLTRDSEWNTIGEIETATGVNILVSTELDLLSELNGLVGDDDVAGLAAVQTFATGTKTVTAKFDFGGGTLEIPNGTTPPACLPGEIYQDTDATSGRQLYACEGTSFVLQGDGGSGGSGDVLGPASATDNAFARFDTTTGKSIQNSAATLDDNGFPTWGIGYAGGWAMTVGGPGKTSASSVYCYGGDVDAEPCYFGLQQGDAATKEEAYIHSSVDGVNGRLAISASVPTGDTSDYILTQMNAGCVDASGTDDYVCSPTPHVGAYIDGHKYWIKPGLANTLTATAKINDLAVLSILDQNGAALTTNCITAGEWIQLTYNGTQFNLGYPCPGSASIGTDDVGTDELDDNANTPVSGYLVAVDTDALSFRYLAVPDCDNATTSKLLFDTTTVAFSCGSDQNSGGGGGSAATNGILMLSLDGGGSAISTGIAKTITTLEAITITEARVYTEGAACSIQVDIWADTTAALAAGTLVDADSITASAPVALTSDIYISDSTLTGWTTSIAAGSAIRFNVDSADCVTANIQLVYEKAVIGTGSVTMTIDGGGSTITTGNKKYLRVPYSGTITRVTTLADQSCSIVVDIWKDTYANYPPVDADSITASAPPTISAAVKAQDSTLTGWTTSVTAGDILGFNVDSVTSCTWASVQLDLDKS